MSIRHLALAVAASLALSACGGNEPATSAKSADDGSTDAPAATAEAKRENPFFQPSPLQYGAPQFDKYQESDYLPALERGMAEHEKEVEAIANNPEPPTFDNTLIAMEKSGALLGRVTSVFYNLTSSYKTDTLKEVEKEIAPKMAAHSDAIYLNQKLWERIKAIHDESDAQSMDAESQRLVERYYTDFVRAGAKLSDADKQKVKDINAQLAELSTDFGNRVVEDGNESSVVVDDVAELDGMSEADISAAAGAAKARGLDGKYLIALQNTTTQPALASLTNRDLRKRIYDASVNRGRHGGPNDTREIIVKMAKLRAEKAQLLGYPNWATYILSDNMAKSPEAALELLTGIVKPAVDKAKGEAADIQKLIDAQGGDFKLQPWDWDFYAEQVRKANYDLDESAVRPYFELDRVLKDGVFFAANKLYGLTFKERTDLPVYSPDVRVFEVFNDKGESFSLIYLDYYKRDIKRGGAWMNSFVDQSHLLGRNPVVVNNLNVPKPAEGQPTLLSFDNVNTMFHEFGHLLHGILSDVNYPMFSGTNTPRDFVEFPSQFNENWVFDPEVFANFAKHYQTGEPMPAELVEKIKKSSTFNQGYATVEYLAAALQDIAWHQITPNTQIDDAMAFQQKALEGFGIAMNEVPPRYNSTYFNHIFSDPTGYSAGYYAYLWTEVLAQDAFEWFKENAGDKGVMNRENGQIFADKILSRGGTKDVHTLYVEFRGKEPSVEPLLEKRGLNETN